METLFYSKRGVEAVEGILYTYICICIERSIRLMGFVRYTDFRCLVSSVFSLGKQEGTYSDESSFSSVEVF